MAIEAPTGPRASRNAVQPITLQRRLGRLGRWPSADYAICERTISLWAFCCRLTEMFPESMPCKDADNAGAPPTARSGRVENAIKFELMYPAADRCRYQQAPDRADQHKRGNCHPG